MSGAKTTIFIVANEKASSPRFGERDYALAIAHELKENANPNTDCHFYKVIADTTTPLLNASDATGNAGKLPLDNNSFAEIPHLNLHELAQLGPDIQIVGLGDSTLEEALGASEYLRKQGIQTSLSLVAHMGLDAERDKKLKDHGGKIMGPFESADLVLDAVPHTNTFSSCSISLDGFIKTANGQKVRAMIDTHEDFAIVIPNAGFPINSTTRVPYTAQEAKEHGAALSRYLGKKTNLFITDGGPRNRDDRQSGEDTTNAFIEGYLEAHNALGWTPMIVAESLCAEYNSAKAAFLLSQEPNCTALICSSDGYGTMDGAILFANNKKILLGMFDFEAQHTSEDRLQNMQNYRNKGISLFGVTHGLLSVDFPPENAETPIPDPRTAHRILRHLELLNEKTPIPSLKNSAMPA